MLKKRKRDKEAFLRKVKYAQPDFFKDPKKKRQPRILIWGTKREGGRVGKLIPVIKYKTIHRSKYKILQWSRHILIQQLQQAGLPAIRKKTIIEFPLNKYQVILPGNNRKVFNVTIASLKYIIVYDVLVSFPFLIEYIINHKERNQINMSVLLKLREQRIETVKKRRINKKYLYRFSFGDEWVEKIYNHPRIDDLFNILFEWAISFDNHHYIYKKNSDLWKQIFKLYNVKARGKHKFFVL